MTSLHSWKLPTDISPVIRLLDDEVLVYDAFSATTYCLDEFSYAIFSGLTHEFQSLEAIVIQLQAELDMPQVETASLAAVLQGFVQQGLAEVRFGETR